MFEWGPSPVCASGGFGASKSWAFCLKALYLSDLFPGNRGVIARQVYEELKSTTMATFFKVCPPDAYKDGRRSDSEKYLRLNNGSEILWMHLDDPELEKVIRGLEINWFFLDQAEEINEQIFDLLCSRLGRWDKAQVPEGIVNGYALNGKPWPWINPQTKQPIVPTYAMLACNPESELHWLYRRFHPESQEHYEKRLPEMDTSTGQPTGKKLSYHDLGYKMFTMSSLDNKFLPPQNRAALLAQDETFVRRFVYAQWGIPEGQIHNIPKEAIIPGDPEFVNYIRHTCTLHRVLDHGDSAPTACAWYAIDTSGNVIFFREYYMPNKLISEHRANIVALSEDERYQSNLADPSIFFKVSQREGGRYSVADEYAEMKSVPRGTAIFWQKADNNELGTRNRINEYLRVDPIRVHPYTKEKGAPRLFFVQKSSDYQQGCDHIIRETRSQRRVRIGTDNGRPQFSDERDESIPDHGYDLVRYAIASRPPLAPILARKPSKWSWANVHKATLEANRQGSWRRMQQMAMRRKG